MRMVGAGRRVFRGIVEEIEQRLLEQHRIDRRPSAESRRELQIDTMAGENFFGAAQRAADDLAKVMRREVRRDRARFQLGHVEQVGDEPIEPFRLRR